MGIRRKIIIGFLSLAALLVFSSVVSFFELGRIGTKAQQIHIAGERSMELSSTMLDAAQEQNFAVLETFLTGQTQYDTVFLAGRDSFAAALQIAEEQQLQGLDSVRAAFDEFRNVSDMYIVKGFISDTEWLLGPYKDAYRKLVREVKHYMIHSQNTLGPQAQALETNAYRAITPSLITTGVMILIVLMFLYFIDLYFVLPVIRLNKSLGDWLAFKVPFNVRMEGGDEPAQLKEKIEELISQIKNSKK